MQFDSSKHSNSFFFGGGAVVQTVAVGHVGHRKKLMHVSRTNLISNYLTDRQTDEHTGDIWHLAGARTITVDAFVATSSAATRLVRTSSTFCVVHTTTNDFLSHTVSM